MARKIKINGEFTKEELQEKLNEFDKPVWEVKKVDGYIELFKNGINKCALLHKDEEIRAFNLSTISRDMARAMDDLMETKDVLDDEELGHYIFFDSDLKYWCWNSSYDYTSNKHFKTEETAILAAKLLNESKDMKDWIKRVSNE